MRDLNWSDESYVRIYTRDTIGWNLLPWETQGLFALLKRKVDRAGVLQLGRHGLRGVSALIGGPGSWDTIEPHLDALLADGWFELHGEGDDAYLFIPGHMEAEEAHSSSAARMRKSRERAAATSALAAAQRGAAAPGDVDEQDAGPAPSEPAASPPAHRAAPPEPVRRGRVTRELMLEQLQRHPSLAQIANLDTADTLCCHAFDAKKGIDAVAAALADAARKADINTAWDAPTITEKCSTFIAKGRYRPTAPAGGDGLRLARRPPPPRAVGKTGPMPADLMGVLSGKSKAL